MRRRSGIRILALVMGLVGAAAAPAATAPDEAKDKAREAYDEYVRAFLNSDWAQLKKANRTVGRHWSALTAKQRADVGYVRKAAPACRPAWWAACKSTRKTRFRARIWDRAITVNFEPAQQPDLNATVHRDLRQISLTVRWNPSLIDSTTPERGSLAERHSLTGAEVGEVIVWRQLGQSYILVSVPVKTLLALYNRDQLLYRHLQEFYANLTSLYHCSPKARRTAMLIHTRALRGQENAEAYVRSCRAMAALFLAEALQEPKKWPSVKLPWDVPARDVERSTAAYVYANLEPSWTLDEDRALREALRKLLKVNGAQVLRARGRIQLPNKTTFMLMEPDDRTHQAKRDAWVKKQLEKALKP
jgi:hypothetical protein